jgi:ER-bound oxygenase mpaB/B'/Rubber oxygenase, catalytic domain
MSRGCLAEILASDPVKDHQRIVYLMACHEFPWDMTRALELALFRTYCVPTISGLLDRTGEFRQRPQKRYDDTDLIISSLMEEGYDSAAGRAAVARMNAIHGRFPISNEDFLYVLSTFVFVPLAWFERFGRRPPTGHERLALFHFWRQVGARMGIRDIPESYEAFAAYHRDYEATRYRYEDSNRHVGEATRELFASWFPRPLGPLVRLTIHALLDEANRRAFGFADPPAWLAALATGALRLRAGMLRLAPVRQRPRLRTRMSHRSYPGGWTLTDIGPPWISGKPTPGESEQSAQDQRAAR